MRFTATGNTAGDGITPYKVTDYEATTVGEFINEVLECYPHDWGSVYVGDGRFLVNSHCEYNEGKLHGEFQKTTLKKKIESVKATGGWSRMDYAIKVKE